MNLRFANYFLRYSQGTALYQGGLAECSDPPADKKMAFRGNSYLAWLNRPFLWGRILDYFVVVTDKAIGRALISPSMQGMETGLVAARAPS